MHKPVLSTITMQDVYRLLCAGAVLKFRSDYVPDDFDMTWWFEGDCLPPELQDWDWDSEPDVNDGTWDSAARDFIDAIDTFAGLECQRWSSKNGWSKTAEWRYMGENA